MRQFIYVLTFLSGYIIGGVCGFPLERKQFGTVWTNEITRKQRNWAKRKSGRQI